MKECGGGVVDERSKRCHDSSKFGVGHRGHRSRVRVRFFGIITLHIHLGVLRALLLLDSTQLLKCRGRFLDNRLYGLVVTSGSDPLPPSADRPWL